MNYGIIRYIVGKMLLMEGVLLLIPTFVSLLYQESSGVYFLIVIAILTVLSLLLSKKPEDMTLYAKEGFVIVALAWILWSVFGALPFVFSGCIPRFDNAFFEIVSGFTTTGSTILTDIEALPMGMNFWRCFTHWIGGMGVLVFVMSILPLSPKNSMFLMRAEMPGPTCDKLVPKARSTARILYGMYIVLSLAEVILLLAGGMNLYDALVHTFSTAGTGGFDNRNANVAFYDSAYIDGVITVFMLLFGVNFSAYFLLLRRKVKQAFSMEEVRWYLLIILASIALITLSVRDMYGSVGEAARHAAFQVGSIITTTGYASTDFNLWPEVPRTILVLLMFVGACAGSTGGGIKVSRLVILVKTIKKELHTLLHPRSLKKLKMDGHALEHETVRATNVFLIAYVLIFSFSVLLVAFDGNDLITNFTAVASALNNIGPGLELVGPMGNFGLFSNGAKLVLIFDMLAGRLEIFPLLLLFVRDTWKKF